MASWAVECGTALRNRPASEPDIAERCQATPSPTSSCIPREHRLPKGAVLSHRKTFFNVLNSDMFFDLTTKDIMIITRPCSTRAA